MIINYSKHPNIEFKIVMYNLPLGQTNTKLPAHQSPSDCPSSP